MVRRGASAGHRPGPVSSAGVSVSPCAGSGRIPQCRQAYQSSAPSPLGAVVSPRARRISRPVLPDRRRCRSGVLFRRRSDDRRPAVEGCGGECPRPRAADWVRADRPGSRRARLRVCQQAQAHRCAAGQHHQAALLIERNSLQVCKGKRPRERGPSRPRVKHRPNSVCSGRPHHEFVSLFLRDGWPNGNQRLVAQKKSPGRSRGEMRWSTDETSYRCCPAAPSLHRPCAGRCSFADRHWAAGQHRMPAQYPAAERAEVAMVVLGRRRRHRSAAAAGLVEAGPAAARHMPPRAERARGDMWISSNSPRCSEQTLVWSVRVA